MGWETRGHGRYYYRKVRRRGRVHSEYIGAGWIADMAADADELARHRRQQEAAEWRAHVEHDRQQVAALAQVDEALRHMTTAALIAAGCYQHRRQWRRPRGAL